MKYNFLKKAVTGVYILSVIFFSNASLVYAQFIDYGSYTSPIDYGSYTSPVDYGSYTSPVDYGSYTSPVYPDYTSPTYYPDYTSPTYPDYTSPTYYPDYTSPVYTSQTYSYPTTYGSTNYGYTTGVTSPSVSWTGYNYSSYTYPVNTVQYQTCWNGTTIPTTQACPTQTTNQCVNFSDSYTASYNNNYPTCTKVCTNGTTIASNSACPAPTANQCSNISDSYTVSYNNNYPTCTKVCTNGTTIASNALCSVTTTTTPVYVCSNGTTVAYSYQCPTTYTYPNYNYNYSYQTCWDGSVIPSTSLCTSQYKICANGTSIPINQTCYYGNTYIPYVAPQVTKFNSVVTSIATQVTMTSARCNGIGLIANNAPSTGWFEYGETSSLGRTTTSSAIGSSNTAPFSNVLTNLKANTTYFCRAVMQNQYGTVKGSIVPFTTKSTNVTYVKPVSTTVLKKTTTTVKKNQIICIDGSIVSVGSQSSATLLSQGEKLVTLQMVKNSGSLSPNNTVAYTLSYKNLSDPRLLGVVIKVTLPQEITGVSSSVGNYDEATHMLTLNQDTIDPYTEGIITWDGKVVKDASIGKSIVTAPYPVSAVPCTSGHDEVSECGLC